MAVSTTDAFSGPYITNGATIAFPFSFKAPSVSEVSVLLRDAAGVELTPPAYSVALGVDAGGTVTFVSAPPSGNTLIVLLDPYFTQDLEFENGSAWLAEPVNEGYDRSALRDQVLRRDISRSIMAPLGEEGFQLPPAAGRKGKYLGFSPVDGALVPTDSTDGDGTLRPDLESTAADKGGKLVGFKQTGTNTVDRNLGDKGREAVSVDDFISPAAADSDGRPLSVPADTASSIANGGLLRASYRGPGQLTTADGNKRGQWFSHIRARPTTGQQDSIETTYNGDWSNCNFAIEHRITGAGTLGTPATGYLFTNEASAVFTTMESTSGHNEQLNGNEGRTSSVAFRTIVRNYGQGDCMAYNASGFVASTKPGATHWLAQPAVGLFAGDIAAGANHVYLNPREIICHDNGYMVSCVGDVINMNRSNAGIAQGEYWGAYRAQSVGSVMVDNIVSGVGLYRVGIDLAGSFLDFGVNKAAISLKADDRIYGGNASSNGQYTDSFNGNYLTYSSALQGWNFVVFGGSCLQINASQVTVNGVRLAANGGVTLIGLGNYANDAAAAAGNVPINGVYRNGSQLMIRVA